jgi:hypothetical protein
MRQAENLGEQQIESALRGQLTRMFPAPMIAGFTGARVMRDMPMCDMPLYDRQRRVIGFRRMRNRMDQRSLLRRQQQSGQRQTQPSRAQQPVTEMESQHQRSRYRVTGTASVKR